MKPATSVLPGLLWGAILVSVSSETPRVVLTAQPAIPTEGATVTLSCRREHWSSLTSVVWYRNKEKLFQTSPAEKDNPLHKSYTPSFREVDGRFKVNAAGSHHEVRLVINSSLDSGSVWSCKIGLKSSGNLTIIIGNNNMYEGRSPHFMIIIGSAVVCVVIIIVVVVVVALVVIRSRRRAADTRDAVAAEVAPDVDDVSLHTDYSYPSDLSFYNNPGSDSNVYGIPAYYSVTSEEYTRLQFQHPQHHGALRPQYISMDGTRTIYYNTGTVSAVNQSPSNNIYTNSGNQTGELQTISRNTKLDGRLAVYRNTGLESQTDVDQSSSREHEA